MTCREVAELLIDFVSGELEMECREQIREHLDLCLPCMTYLQTYQITIQISRRLPDAPLPAGLEERLRRALEGMRSDLEQ